MIGYVCKYTPLELLECFGESCMKIDPGVNNFEKSDALMHPNMCAYSKAVLEECLNSEMDSLILVNCCDSIKRLYDVLKYSGRFKFLYLIDVPRKVNKDAVTLFRSELTRLIKCMEKYTGIEFNESKLLSTNKSFSYESPQENSINNVPKVSLLGARCKSYIKDVVQESGAEIAYDFTCTGIKREFSAYNGEDMLTWYSYSILNQFPCMRMANISRRYSEISNIAGIDGIIYHTVKFCDSYSYDYAKLKKIIHIPVLKIETDYTSQCDGQIKTRIEAFIESLNSARKKHKNSVFIPRSRKYAVGIDSGSTSTNAVIIDESKNIISYSVLRTGSQSLSSAEKALDEALKKANLAKEDISYIISTGYGRVSIPFADANVTEITCHGKGAFYLNNNIRTVIDIGGQDSKVIRINENGEVTDFVMNDKCAAGTGRFLEMMAQTLEMPIEEMSKCFGEWKENITITSMCTVFAESEVVSLIAHNKNKADIIHGINNSISGKIVSMLERIGKKGPYMMSGGVAQNKGVVYSLSQKLNEKIFIPPEPEIVGALGAALIAIEK